MTKSATAAILAMVALAAASIVPAYAQCNLGGSPITSLRDPLIEGAPNTAPMTSAPEGQPPPIGSGSCPAPVTPGMPGGPTLIPSVPITPANQAEWASTRINWNPANESAAGEAGPNTWAPPPPNTPGADPGILHAPQDFCPPPAAVVNINPNGGIPGGAPTERWGGQQSHDFGRYKNGWGTRTCDFGQELSGSTSEDGPCQTRDGAVGTQDLYGRRYPRRNNGEPIIQTIAPW
jgi:hypothetical protein